MTDIVLAAAAAEKGWHLNPGCLVAVAALVVWALIFAHKDGD